MWRGPAADAGQSDFGWSNRQPRKVQGETGTVWFGSASCVDGVEEAWWTGEDEKNKSKEKEIEERIVKE